MVITNYPLSPCLFIIALETLAIYIRGSDEIKDINIRNEHEIKLRDLSEISRGGGRVETEGGSQLFEPQKREGS